MKFYLPTISKSEEYIKPLIDRLNKHPEFEVVIGCIDPLYLVHNDIDCVIIPSDRTEHIVFAVTAFHNNIPLIQLYGGDISSGTFDDINRWVYSLYASVVFCSTEIAAKRVRAFYDVIGKDTTHVYMVGATHFDDIEIDESDVPDYSYDIVLYNPVTRGRESEKKTIKDLEEIYDLLDKKILWFEPNEDLYRNIIIKFITDHKMFCQERIDRKKFLGLIKNCSRYITNSSSAFYEAKKWLVDDQIIMIGERNKIREDVDCSKGATDRIIKILEEIDFENL